jgi:hypothetical protein
LGSALPTLTKSIAIGGAGALTTAVDGVGSVRVFDVGAPATVTLAALTVQNGRDAVFGAGIHNLGTLTLNHVAVNNNVVAPSLSAIGGGGVWNAGTLTVVRGSFSGNRSFSGGGIATVTGPATVDGATFTSNQAGFGGGIAAFGPLTLRNSTLSQGTSGAGGGMFVGPVIMGPNQPVPTPLLSVGTADVSTTTFDGNSTGGVGGGVAVFPRGSARINSSTFKGNSAGNAGSGGAGGGVFNMGGTLFMLNDTLNANIAVPSGVVGGIAVGGAIAQLAPGDIDTTGCPPGAGPCTFKIRDTPVTDDLPATEATLDYLTIANNSAMTNPPVGGGGIFNHGKDVTLTVHDTIIAGSTGKNCVAPAPLTSSGYNLEDANDCALATVGDQHNSNPNLGALALNAPGLTQTMALSSGSPAVDAADPTSTVHQDQRGVTRPQGPQNDIGAYELQVAAPPPSNPPPTPSSLPAPPATGLGPAGAPDLMGLSLVAFLLVLSLICTGILRRRRTSG